MSAVLALVPVGPPPWPTLDPFLFCVHHLDRYPAGDAAMGPAPSLPGRTLGSDFAGPDGRPINDGVVPPGFPAHPHRGFETVTLARQGFIDHSDSLGATARFGDGDVQWMMFPLVRQDAPNPTELFQLWLNLPAADKMAPPHFTMMWSPTIPRVIVRDADGRATEVVIVAGELGGRRGPPPPSSWAARPTAEVAIWTLRLEPGACFTLPPASRGLSRVLYLFAGAGLEIDGRAATPSAAIQLRSDAPAPLRNGPAPSELLLLQGRPIGEPVAQQGPFVMNHAAELRRTGFGGWPWASDGPVHPRGEGRFAVHADGRRERPGDDSKGAT